MSLFVQWKELAGKEREQQAHDQFWKEYLAKETKNYVYILENHDTVTDGKLSEVAEKFQMDPVTMSGFIDGINTSLVKSIELDEINEESEIKLEIDFEKLYFNMLDAKADWLYNLPQWDGILTEERRKEITKDFRQSKVAVSSKVGRNEPCLCGSGKKYKRCCG